MSENLQFSLPDDLDEVMAAKMENSFRFVFQQSCLEKGEAVK